MVIGDWRKPYAKPVCLFVFWWQKLAYMALLTCTSIPWSLNSYDFLSSSSGIVEKMHTKAVIDVSRNARGKGFHGGDCEGVVGNYRL